MKRDGRRIDFGMPGEADIEAWPKIPCSTRLTYRIVVCYPTLWIECKRPGGKQSRDQRMFEQTVRQLGHAYLLVESAAELEEWLERNLA